MNLSLKQRIELCKKNEYPAAIGKLASGWLVVGDTQPLPGYCMLIADPVAGSLNDLSESERIAYSLDMIRVGDALKKVTGAYRINYETWCNADPVLHTHITPRFLTEPDDKRIATPRTAYDWAGSRPFDPVLDGDFILAMRQALHLSKP